MELNKIELEKVEQAVKQAGEVEMAIQELADLQLALVGGGMGDVQF